MLQLEVLFFLGKVFQRFDKGIIISERLCGIIVRNSGHNIITGLDVVGAIYIDFP